jgi:P-type Mg2+ transporter
LRRASEKSASEDMEIDRKDVVPGDILAFTSTQYSYQFAFHAIFHMCLGGDVFPGDCVIIAAEGVTVTQASLTGELMPVEKSARLDLPPGQFDFDILDNLNVCLAGTSVATGSGRALVVTTNVNTYLASIAKDLAKMRPLNSSQVGIRNVSYLLLAFMAVSRYPLL